MFMSWQIEFDNTAVCVLKPQVFTKVLSIFITWFFNGSFSTLVKNATCDRTF